MPIITVEDHWHEGRLGKAVLSALARNGRAPVFASLALSRMPHSGRTDQLLSEAGIDANGIARIADILRAGVPAGWSTRPALDHPVAPARRVSASYGTEPSGSAAPVAPCTGSYLRETPAEREPVCTVCVCNQLSF
jgi:hypothetical protein